MSGLLRDKICWISWVIGVGTYIGGCAEPQQIPSPVISPLPQEKCPPPPVISTLPQEKCPPLDANVCAEWAKANVCPFVKASSRPETRTTVGFLQGAESEISGKPVPKLMLFGGADHKTYLGCLNCTSEATDSIWNAKGQFGPGNHFSTTIWGKFGEYGTDYGSNSPWASYASSPPIVVDETGNSYGRFTVNQYDYKRTKIPEILFLLDIAVAFRASR
jgi:hypothetical protein